MSIIKHPHTVCRAETALLVIDVQEKLAPAIPQFDGIVANIVRMVLAFQMFKMPILVTERHPREWGSTVGLIRGQFSLLDVTERLECACTANNEFVKQLARQDVTSLVVCGVESHACVNQTVLGLLQAGYTVHAVGDAMGSRNRLDHDTALLKMHHAGAIPSTTEIVLFELAEKSGTEEFKVVQKMVTSRIRKPEIDIKGTASAIRAPVHEPCRPKPPPASAATAPKQPETPTTTPHTRMVDKSVQDPLATDAREGMDAQSGISGIGARTQAARATADVPPSLSQTQVLDLAVREVLGLNENQEGAGPTTTMHATSNTPQPSPALASQP